MHDEHPLRAVLDTVGPESCPGLLNFHCHTVCSDGSLEPIALIEQASERKLSHLAVTDHHSIAAYVPMVALAERPHRALVHAARAQHPRIQALVADLRRQSTAPWACC